MAAPTSSRPSAARRLSAIVALASIVLLTATSCVTNVTGPVRTTTTFEHKAAATAAVAASDTATAALLAQAGADDRAMFPYLSVVVSECEDGLGAARTTFDAIQPPTREAEAVRDELDDLLEAASSDLTEARVAIRRGDREPLGDLAGRLQGDADALSEFEERYR